MITPIMPHTPEAKKKAISRLRRIRGQTEALERAVESGTDCGPLLQQLAALRGAVNGMIFDILDSHMRETFTPQKPAKNNNDMDKGLDDALALIRSYLK